MEYYNLGEKPGYYIIFNHEYYSEEFCPPGKPEIRTGTDRDANIINFTFNQLGFLRHETDKDSNKQQIFENIKEVFSRDFTNFGSIFVFILTHGTEGYTLKANDTTYTLYELLDHAMQHASPSLNGKPKVFVIQACNGLKMDHSTNWSADRAFDMDCSPQPFILPEFPDVLLAFSSPPGYLSARNVFIPILCKSIQSYKEYGYDLEKLLTLTRRKVGARITAYGDTEYGDAPRKQISISISTLTKKLQLTPRTINRN